jgi:hypothetical protein
MVPSGRNRGLGILAGVAFAALAGTAPLAQHDAHEAKDAWQGKPRSEVVTLLGEPDKTTRSKEGSTIVYRLFRIEQGAPADPELVPVLVPGVGLVARRSEQSDPFGGRSTTFEPTVLDEEGHPSGGLTTTESRSVTWSKKEGATVRSEGSQRAATHRRVKLAFHLDGVDRVRDWTVDPKPERTGAP